MILSGSRQFAAPSYALEMRSDAERFLAELELPWRRCLELAWDAFVAGSIPVGGVLTDPSDTIVSEGRNRTFETDAPLGELAGTSVAHAEINVLASLPPGDYPNHVLWSSLEPCALCSGAIVHAHVGQVLFAAADPVMSGVADLPKINAYVKSRWPDRTGPVSGPLGDFAGLVHLVWNMEGNANGVVARATKQADFELFDLGRRCVDSGVLRAAGVNSFEDALDAVWDELVAISER